LVRKSRRFHWHHRLVASGDPVAIASGSDLFGFADFCVMPPGIPAPVVGNQFKSCSKIRYVTSCSDEVQIDIVNPLGYIAALRNQQFNSGVNL
jgi:hypothetical protein